MAWNFEYPYVDSAHYNNDWLLKTIKELIKQLDEFVNLNKIKYADPIGWDITRQYEANTIVVDNRTGNAYISSRPVPAGVQIGNTYYWTEIYNYANIIDTLRAQIAINEGDNTTATQDIDKGRLVFISGLLYKATADINAGDRFVVNSNIESTTIEAELINIVRTLKDKIDAEEQARAESDSTLQDNIDAEARTRAENDDALQDSIDTLRQSVTEIEQSMLKYTRVYNVKDFGAKGDGVTDDTEAIRACIAFINNEGLNTKKNIVGMIFPNGHYKITDQIILPEHCHVCGTNPKIGLEYHKLPSNNTNGTWLYICDNSNNDINVNSDNDNGTICLRNGSKLSGFGIYYPEQQLTNNQAKVYRPTIYLGRYANTEVSDIYCVNPYIFMYCEVRHAHTYIHDIDMGPIYRGIINYYAPEGDTIENVIATLNYFAYCDGVDSHYADLIKQSMIFIEIHGSDWGKIINCNVYGGYIGYYFTYYLDDGNVQRGARHIRLINCECETITYEGVEIAGDESSYPSNCFMIEGGVYQTSGGSNVINSYGCEDLHVFGVTFRAYQHAVNMPKGDILDVKNCHFFDYGVRSGQNGRGIVCGAPKAVIIGNIFNGQMSQYCRGIGFYNDETDSPIVIGNYFRNMQGYNPCVEFNGATTNRAIVLFNSMPSVTNPISGTLNRSNMYQTESNGYVIKNLVKSVEYTGTTNGAGGLAISGQYSGEIIGVIPKGNDLTMKVINNGAYVFCQNTDGTIAANTEVTAIIKSI